MKFSAVEKHLPEVSPPDAFEGQCAAGQKLDT
jgi:hypothetical protein